MTVDLAPAYLQALAQAAAQAKLTLHAYVTEIVESHAATLLLPNVVPSGGKAGGAVRDENGEAEGTFPWPSDTYRVHF